MLFNSLGTWRRRSERRGFSVPGPSALTCVEETRGAAKSFTFILKPLITNQHVSEPLCGQAAEQ